MNNTPLTTAIFSVRLTANKQRSARRTGNEHRAPASIRPVMTTNDNHPSPGLAAQKQKRPVPDGTSLCMLSKTKFLILPNPVLLLLLQRVLTGNSEQRSDRSFFRPGFSQPTRFLHLHRAE